MPNFWQLATLSIHKMQHNTLRIFIFDWKVSNFVSLPWKLINPYYHSLDSLGMCPPSCKVWIDPLEKQDWTTFFVVRLLTSMNCRVLTSLCNMHIHKADLMHIFSPVCFLLIAYLNEKHLHYMFYGQEKNKQVITYSMHA